MAEHGAHRAKSKGPSPAKAKKILHHGSVKGHKLTSKQRRFMGARASGQPVRRAKAKGKR